MRERSNAFIAFIIFITIFTPFSVIASAQTEAEPKSLIIYSSESGEVGEYERMLDLLVGHFTTDITLKSSEEVEKKDLTGVSHVIYFGQIAKKVPSSFQTLFDDFIGSFMAIGYNASI